MDITTALNLYNPGRGMSGPAAWLGVIPALDVVERRIEQANNNGMGQGIDFTSIINRGIDVVGSVFGKQPVIVDPRLVQPPQNVYMYPAPTPGYVPPPGVPVTVPPKPSGVGIQLSQNTLLLAAGAVLIFLVASKK